jgi:nucleotide-binding universal stress UspA family protein
MKLLCATDGSRYSEKAVAYAVGLAKSTGSDLTFITINTVTAKRTSKTHFWDERLIKAADAQISRELGLAVQAAKKAGLKGVACVAMEGKDIAAAVWSYAKARGFDHIVTGTAGRGRAGRLLLGSVAADIVAAAHCPVTVVR